MNANGRIFHKGLIVTQRLSTLPQLRGGARASGTHGFDQAPARGRDAQMSIAQNKIRGDLVLDRQTRIGKVVDANLRSRVQVRKPKA